MKLVGPSWNSVGHSHYAVAKVCPDAIPSLHVERRAYNIVEDNMDAGY